MLDDHKVDVLIERMRHSITPTIGWWLRWRAAHRLAAVRSPRAVKGLARAYVFGGDKRVTSVAARALAELDDQVSVDIVCDLMIATGDERLTELVATAGYEHSDPSRRALMLFLAGEFERYAEVDADGAALRSAQVLADETLRARLAGRARASARLDWVRLIAGAGTKRRAVDLSHAEWAAAIGILTATGRWEELWRLVREAPPAWGVRILRELARRRWRPHEVEQGGFDELAQLALSRTVDTVRVAMPSEPRILRGHRKHVPHLAVTPDGELLASAAWDRSVRLWRLPSGEPVSVFDGRNTTGLLVTGDGSTLIASTFSPVLRWRLPSGEPAGELSTAFDEVGGTAQTGLSSLVETSDGRFLVGTGSSGLTAWRMPGGEPAGHHSLSGISHANEVAVSLAAEGRIILGGFDGKLSLWTLPGCVLLSTQAAHEGPISCLATSPEGRLLATGGHDGRVRLWRLPHGDPIDTPSGPAGHENWLSRLAITPDGALLISGDLDGLIRLWRLPFGEPAAVLRGHRGAVTDLAVTSDGGLLASGGADGTIRLWELPSGMSAGVLSGHEDKVLRLVITPDGELLASGGLDRSVRLWRLWNPVLRELSHTGLGQLDWHDVARLKSALRGRTGPEQDWAAMIAALVRWRHGR
ncbi:WD40 repeat domain-containing protein [Actinomycetes bacterium KLBMP 9797]